jgi:diguanylate cyclase (GGDEF)-like protein
VTIDEADKCRDHREEHEGGTMSLLETPLTEDRGSQNRAVQLVAVATALLGSTALVERGLSAETAPLVAAIAGSLLLAAGLPIVLRREERRSSALALAVLALAPGVVATLAPGPAVLVAAACLLVCTGAIAAVVLLPALALVPVAVAMASFGVALVGVDVASPLLAWAVVSLTLAAVSGVVAMLSQHLRGLVRTDPVTLVANRRFWEHTVEHECARAARTTHPLCVAVVVVDDFRQYAFERGHAAAEQVLRESAAAWSAQVRGGDLVGRLGPDQLAVLLPECGSTAAKLVLSRLQTATPTGRTCSAGLAMWDGAESATTLVERAAGALRLAQRTGHSYATISAA